MTTTIGRCSFDNGPSFLSWDGDALSLGINILPASLELAKVMRQQMLGLMNNPDESAIPVTCSTDSDLDGFYTVTAVQVEPVEAYITNKLMRCSLGLVRVANGYQNPTIETTVVSRLATNAHGVLSTTNFGVAAVSTDTTDTTGDYTGLAGLLIGGGEGIVTHDGDTLLVYTFSDTNVSGYSAQFGNPATYYDAGSCKIEYSTDGSTWYEVVGRHVPNGVAWRISNGFVRLGTIATMPEDQITFEVADSSQYRGSGVTVVKNLTYSLGGLVGPFILRNSPEMVSVKVQAGNGLFLTYSVWSGGTIVMLSYSSTSAIALDLVTATSETGTSVTGGVKRSSNDANGNRMHLLCRSAVTAFTSDPWKITLTSASTSAVFGIGVDLGGADTAGSLFSSAGLLGQLCAPPQWRRRVAAR